MWRTAKGKRSHGEGICVRYNRCKDFPELDQLYKKLGMSAKERLDRYHQYTETFSKRDDVCVEYATLLNMNGMHKEAYDYIMSRKFHPWEGGEGKITAQYTISLVELAKAEIKAENYDTAKNYLEQILVSPKNLGEGKLEGTKDNDAYYYLGIVYEKNGDIKRRKNVIRKPH